MQEKFRLLKSILAFVLDFYVVIVYNKSCNQKIISSGKKHLKQEETMKKLITLFLALILLVSAFAACSTPGGSTDGSKPAGNGGDATPAPGGNGGDGQPETNGPAPCPRSIWCVTSWGRARRLLCWRRKTPA